jgi:thiamine biosynthesis protein ThiS
MTITSAITIFLNGQARQISSHTTIAELVLEVGLQPQQVLVEVNLVALTRHEWLERRLEHGDRVEFIKVVAGG